MGEHYIRETVTDIDWRAPTPMSRKRSETWGTRRPAVLAGGPGLPTPMSRNGGETWGTPFHRGSIVKRFDHAAGGRIVITKMSVSRVAHPSRLSKGGISERMKRRRSSRFGGHSGKFRITFLPSFNTVTQTRLRARGVRETRHSVTVANAGSNPAGSILPFVEEKSMRRERRDNLLK